MNVARAEIRRSRRIALHGKENGTTEISEQALSSVIRFAATAIPGIHARRCHIEIRSGGNDPSGEDRPSGNTATAANEGAHLIINLRVAAAPSVEIPRTVDSLRQRISNAITACVGISAGTINITVEDLYDV
ncbi:Asp23/Gls24 family envelope stress response protein [Paenarthrobacter sp. PH39-S1]|nr:Asp23/Gls24 family envelope stress response protein [Paenarthrobacter sp. PH39-S1]MDJ0358524.1 Asp23/Gls24 family envelope stress response protein [Paenarthrobacter sp. PH39-S1]